jgi:Mpv17 / PMP22 family
MSTFFATWFRLSKQYPVTFNSLTGGSLCACSDALAQYLETKNLHDQHATSTPNENGLSFRIRRVASAGLIGAFFGGWVYPAAYARLDAMWKGTHFSAVVQKSVVEILTVGIFVNSVSMSSRGLLVGRDNQEVALHVAKEMPTVTFNDARVWFPYNIVAFSLIPVTIRPTTTLMLEAGWQTYISIMSNNYDEAATVKGTSTAKTPVEHKEPLVLPVGLQTGGVVIAASPR